MLKISTKKIIKPEEEQMLMELQEQICEENERVEAIDLVEDNHCQNYQI